MWRLTWTTLAWLRTRNREAWPLPSSYWLARSATGRALASPRSAIVARRARQIVSMPGPMAARPVAACGRGEPSRKVDARTVPSARLQHAAVCHEELPETSARRLGVRRHQPLSRGGELGVKHGASVAFGHLVEGFDWPVAPEGALE